MKLTKFLKCNLPLSRPEPAEEGLNDSRAANSGEERRDESGTIKIRFSHNICGTEQRANTAKMRGVVAVQGACVRSVNGVYRFSGIFDSVGKYTKRGMWQGKLVTFTLYRCKHQDTSRRWYISIVDKHRCPGTRFDTDLFTALAATYDENHLYYRGIPPEDGWKVVVGSELKGPAPTCLHIANDEEEDIREERKLSMCVVCLDKPVNHVCVPCGHPCLCTDCFKGKSWVEGTCPVARCPIDSVIRIYGTVVEDNVLR